MSTPAPIVMHEYADAAAMGDGLCEVLRGALREACAARGRAVFALAGGRTPLAAYARFAALCTAGLGPASKAVARAAATPATGGGQSAHANECALVLIPTDERCVPHAHPASNVAALRELFGATHARIESLTSTDGAGDASLRDARARLACYAAPFDLVLLGMGEDAHTASLFPGAPQLREALDTHARHDAFLIDPDPLPPDAPFSRITLGAARLLRTRALHVALTGARKREVFERALAGADALAAPIALLRDAAVAVHVHWSPA